MTDVAVLDIPKAMPKERTPWQLAMGRFSHNKIAIAGLVVVFVLIASAIASPYISPYDPIKRNIKDRFSPPSQKYFLGTDYMGRDIFTRILWGGRISLWVGLASVLLSLGLGVPIGLMSGYFGGLLDGVSMRIMDLILAFPGIIFAIWLVAMIGPGVNQVIIANAIFSLPEYSRVIRGNVLTMKNADYISACKAMGGNSFEMISRHIFPNVLAPIIIISSLSISGAILAGASLSFLGLGAQPPTPEWGAMLADGRKELTTGIWWPAVFPGILLTLVVLAMNLTGDGLRDALDPRVSTKH